MEGYIFLGLLGVGIVLLFVGFFVGRKADAEWKDQAQYFPVSIPKFLIMSYVTLGFYNVYWFYKNWWIIKERDSTNAWPFWRAVFSGIWFYPLMNNVRNNSTFQISTAMAALLAISYFLIGGFHTRYGFRGDFPLPILFGIFVDFSPFLLLLPLAIGINKINGPDNYALAKNSRFGPLAILAILIGGPLALYTSAAFINAIPTDKLYEPAYLWEKDLDIIEEVGFFEEDEDLIYFYSVGFLSIHDDGNFMTTKKIVSYELNAEGDKDIYFLYFENIDSLEVDYGSTLDDTVLAAFDQYGDGFYLLLPGRKKRAKQFIERLEHETGLTALEVEF